VGWFGARVVRILQDFAGICRANCLILFVFRVGQTTHNP
jgi:hypothetical protein